MELSAPWKWWARLSRPWRKLPVGQFPSISRWMLRLHPRAPRQRPVMTRLVVDCPWRPMSRQVGTMRLPVRPGHAITSSPSLPRPPLPLFLSSRLQRNFSFPHTFVKTRSPALEVKLAPTRPQAVSTPSSCRPVATSESRDSLSRCRRHQLRISLSFDLDCGVLLLRSLHLPSRPAPSPIPPSLPVVKSIFSASIIDP